MTYLIMTLIVYCFATILFELIPASCMKDKREWRKTSLICNIITNPIINTLWLILLYVKLPAIGFFISIFVLEVAVILFECYIYEKRLNKPRKMCMKFSLIANLISVLSGVLVFFLHNILIPVTSAYRTPFTFPIDMLA